MVLVLVREWARTGAQPPARHRASPSSPTRRPAGSSGPAALVDEQPNLFADCSEAIRRGRRLQHHRPRRPAASTSCDRQEGPGLDAADADGKPGARLFRAPRQRRHPVCQAVARLGEARLPTCSRADAPFLDAVSDAYGIEIIDGPSRLWPGSGSISPDDRRGLRNTANPTMLDAGYKTTSSPAPRRPRSTAASSYGQEAEFERQLAGLIGEGIQREWLVYDQAVETTFDGPWSTRWSPRSRPRTTAPARFPSP